MPAHWPGYKVHYRYRETVYHIAIEQTRAGDDGRIGVTSVKVDGVEQNDRTIHLVDDHREHSVAMMMHAR